MPPAGNKFLQLLDQGLSAFIFEKDEQDKPILSDNPLMVAPWRDELEEFIESTEPTLHSLITCGILMDSKGGIIFSSLAGTSHRLLPWDNAVCVFLPQSCQRHILTTGCHCSSLCGDDSSSCRPDFLSELQKGHTVSAMHITAAASRICTVICNTVSSKIHSQTLQERVRR